MEDDVDLLSMLIENIKKLSSCTLVDDNFSADDYLNIDFDVCTNKTCVMTDQEILDLLSTNEDCAEEEQVKEEQLEVDGMLQKHDDDLFLMISF